MTNKKQRGGFTRTTRPMRPTTTHPMRPTTTTPMHTLQTGGSPASELVMQDTRNPPVTNDYVTSHRIRDPFFDNSLSSQVGGASTIPEISGKPSPTREHESITRPYAALSNGTLPKQSLIPSNTKPTNSMNIQQDTRIGNKVNYETTTETTNGFTPQSTSVTSPSSQGVVDNSRRLRLRLEKLQKNSKNPVSITQKKLLPTQEGGSPASEMVMESLHDLPETKPYPKQHKVAADINSLNLYQTTGGSRRRNKRKTRKHKRTHKKSHKKRQHRQRGGYGSDWMSSQYSLGNINAPAMPASMVGQFSRSAATDRNTLMNPPNMGLAGSGYPLGSLEGGNVNKTGAPLM